MLPDTREVQRSLEEYYGEKLGKNARITDLAYIEKGIVHYMYSFRLEYVEGATTHSCVVRACFFLFITSMIETRGADEFGLKGNADTLMQPGFNIPRACAEVIEEKTGIEVWQF